MLRDRYLLRQRFAPKNMYSSRRSASSLEPELSIAGSLKFFPFPSIRGRTPDSSPASSHPLRNLLETSLRRDLPA